MLTTRATRATLIAFVSASVPRTGRAQPSAIIVSPSETRRQPTESDHARPDQLGVYELGATLGAVSYTSTYWDPLFPGGYEPPGPFVSRGVWVGAELSVAVFSWMALAARARIGSMQHGPPTTPGDVLYPPDQSLSSLDPQRGDPSLGGALALLIRFLPGRTALDAGVTRSFGPFRNRLDGESVSYTGGGGDDYKGQLGFSPQDWWPTFRVSRTGTGFFFAVSTGEGFVRTHEVTLFEVLLGIRRSDFELMGGISRGLALRGAVRIAEDLWLALDLSTAPWTPSIESQTSLRSIMALTLSWRRSSFAPW